MPKFISGISQLGDASKQLNAINFAMNGLNIDNISNYRAAVLGLSKEQATLLLSTKGLNQAQIDLILSNEQVTATQIAEAASLDGINAKKSILTAENQKQLLASKLLTTEKLAEIASTIGLETAENGSLISKKALNAEMVKQQLESLGVVGSAQAQIMSMLGLTTAETGAATASNVLSGAMAKLNIVLATNPIGALITAIGIAIGSVFLLKKGFDAVTDSAEDISERTEELITKYNEMKNTADNNAKTVESLADEYETLSKGVNGLGKNVSLTSDEYDRYNEIVNQIAEMFPELVAGYTDEGNAILSLKGNVEGLKDAYKEAQQEAYNLLVATGKDDNGNDIMEDYKNLSELDWWDAPINLESVTTTVKRDIAKQILDLMSNMDTAVEEYDKLAKDIFDKYGSVGYDYLEEMGLPAITGTFSDTTGITKEALVAGRATVQSYYQGFQSEINNKLGNVRLLANAFLNTNDFYKDDSVSSEIKNTLSLIVNSIDEEIANSFNGDPQMVGAFVNSVVNGIKESDGEIKDAITDLFTNQELSPEQKNNLIKQIQDYFGKDNPISVFLQPQFEENETTQNNIKSAISKFGEGSKGDLKAFFEKNSINTQEEVDKWNEITNGINDADVAMQAYIDSQKEAKNEVDSLTAALKAAESAFELFNEVEKDFNSTGAISSENIQKILNKFPELEDELYEYIMGMRTGASVMDLLKSKSDDMATMSADAFRRMYLSSNSVSKDMKKQFGDTFEAVGLGWDNTQSVMANVNSQIVDANGNVTSTFSEQWANACASAGASVSAFAQGLSTLFSGGIDNIEIKNGVLYSKAADGGTANLVNTSVHKILDDINAKGQGSEYWDTYGSLISFGSNGKVTQASRDSVWSAVNKSYWGQYNANVKNQEEFERKQKEFEERMKQYAITSDDKNSGSDKNEALDNYLKDAENRYKIHQDEAKYIEELQWAHDNLTKSLDEQLDITGKINEAYRDLADNRIKDLEHQIDLTKELKGEDVDVTAQLKEIQKVAHEEANRLRAMGYDDNSNEIQELQKTWWDAEREITENRESRYNDVLDEIQRYADEVSDYYDDINDKLDDQITKEEALLQIRERQFEATNSLSDAQTEINKALADSKISLQYLDEKEREGIFNEKDYEKLSSVIKSTQKDIDKLSSRFYADIIEAYEQDKVYLIDSITAEYERQVAMKERELEIAQAQVDLTKKQIQLNNVLAEKNVKQLVERNGQYVWEWVADTDKVRQAQEELLSAEAELKRAKGERKQQRTLDEQQRRIDELKADQAYNDYLNEQINDKVEAFSKAIENCTDPLRDFGELLAQLTGADSSIVSAFNDASSSLSGSKNTTSKNTPSKETIEMWRNTDYSAEMEYLDKGSIQWQTLNAQRNAKIDYFGLNVPKYANGTRYTTQGKVLMGEDGDELFIDNGGHLIPINQPTLANIGAGGVVFNQNQLNGARTLWDMVNTTLPHPEIQSLSIPQPIDKSMHFGGDIVIEHVNDINDFVKQLTQRFQAKQ